MEQLFEVEIAIEDPAHATDLARMGVHRIELCANLAQGGLTPTPGQAKSTLAQTDLPVYCMIRSRAGNFTFSPAEKDTMLQDVLALAGCGIAGIVIGALTEYGTLDEPFMNELVALAHGLDLGITLHRAIDACTDRQGALTWAAEAGVERVLTSGGEPKVAQGFNELARLVQGPVPVMAGSGVSAAVVDDLWSAGVRMYHCTAMKPKEDALRGAVLDQHTRLGFSGAVALDSDKIEALVSALKAKISA